MMLPTARHLGPACAAVAIAAVFALPARAQDTDTAFSVAVTEQCLRDAGGQYESAICVGLATEQCRDANDGGYGNLGTIDCVQLEQAYWDDMIIAERARLDASAVKSDLALDGVEPAYSLTSTLQDMQDAWAEYRDATCNFQEAMWGGNSGGNAASLGCVMEMTGEQALRLRRIELE